MEVTAVIPVWNRRELLAPLFKSLHRQSHPFAEVLVIDDHSSDGAGEEAGRLGARVVRLPSHSGFARAVNRGIRECRTPLLALINNDVELAPEWLLHLVHALKAPDVWFAAGKVLDALHRDRIDGGWDLLARSACAWRAGHARADEPAFSKARDIPSPPGAAVVFRTALFDELGGFDEQFESYLEDVELGLRCAVRGLRGRYVPEAVAWHLGSATLGRWHADVVRRISRNQVLLARKHLPKPFTWPVVIGQALWGALALRHGRLFSWLRGKVEGFSADIQYQPSDSVPSILRSQEAEIFHLQRRTGFDLYWRMYFLLTSGGSK